MDASAGYMRAAWESGGCSRRLVEAVWGLMGPNRGSRRLYDGEIVVSGG